MQNLNTFIRVGAALAWLFLAAGCGDDDGGDGNEAPQIYSTGYSMLENRQFAGSVVVTDAEDDDVEFSIVGGADGARFTIDALSGAIDFLEPPDFEQPTDANADNVYELEVSVSDGQDSTRKLLRTTVTDVDEYPVFESATESTFPENVKGVVYVAHAADPEGGAIIYSILGQQSEGTGAEVDDFSIDAATGKVRLKRRIDYERGDGSFIVKISAADDAGHQAQRNVYLSATNVPGVVTSGVRLDGAQYESLAFGMASAGDVDGDGKQELLLTTLVGRVVMIFGDALASGLADPRSIAAADLAGIGIEFVRHCNGCVWSVSRAGDVDGDGIADILIGITGVSGGSSTGGGGEVHVVYGATIRAARENGISSFNLRTDAGQVAILAGDLGYELGASVAGGDIDGDGLGDVIAGMPTVIRDGSFTGAAFVVFGRYLRGLSEPRKWLGNVPPNAAARMVGPSSMGSVVAAVPDLDGDGRDEVALAGSGAAFVVTGKTLSRLDGATLDVETLPAGGNGTRIVATAPVLTIGGAGVASPGDMDGDGLPELLIGDGTSGREPTARLLFGHALKTAIADGAAIDVGDLARGDGLAFKLARGRHDYGPVAVAGAGDVDGDGVPDLLLGSEGTHWLDTGSGAAFVIFGKTFSADANPPTWLSVRDLQPSQGVVIPGFVGGMGRSVAGLGDLDGDGRSDIAMGSRGSAAGVSQSGEAYVMSAEMLFDLPRVDDVTIDLLPIFGFEPPGD